MYNFPHDLEEHKKFLYTDLACERSRASANQGGLEFIKSNSPMGAWEHLKIKDEDAAKALGRPCGVYSTLKLTQLDL